MARPSMAWFPPRSLNAPYGARCFLAVQLMKRTGFPPSVLMHLMVLGLSDPYQMRGNACDMYLFLMHLMVLGAF